MPDRAPPLLRSAPRLGASAKALRLGFFLILSIYFFPCEILAQPQAVDHLWRRIFYGELDGQQRLLFASPMDRAKPALGDLDGDGDVDLLIGTAEGTIRYFQNVGSKTKPNWRLLREQISTSPERARDGSQPPGKAIHVGSQAVPALVDIDGDGDLDLFVGAGDGRIRFFRNGGNQYLPLFRLETEDYLGQSFGRDIAIRFADASGDGIPDMVLGNGEGAILFLLNQGTRVDPRFCPTPKPVPPSCLTPAQKVGQLSPVDHAVPAWVDWDGDGDKDLVVGRSDGKLNFYRNIGSHRTGKWELAEERFQILDSGGYSAPLFAELTGDDNVELLLAGDSDQMALYTTKPTGKGPEVWLMEENLLKVARLGRYQSRLQVTSGDLDGDGDADLVVGTRGGKILIYENGGGKGRVVLKTIGGPLLPTTSRAFSAPTLVDLDGDKDLDLVIGDRNGRLELIENVGTTKKARWQIRDLHFGGVDVGSYSIPTFQDLDSNGTMDLLVGNSLGKLVFYQNRGSAQRPLFELRTVEFGGALAKNNAAPAFFLYDKKRPPDLVVGDRSGRIKIAMRDLRIPPEAPNAYRSLVPPWRGIWSSGYSAPHFVDMTGDDKPDLVLGGVEAHLSLWKYEGALSRKTVASNAPKTSDGGKGPLPPGQSLSGLSSQQASSVYGPQAEPPDAVAAPRQLVTTGFAPVFDEAGRLPPLGRIRGAKPAYFDADKDGRADLVVGTAEGNLLLYQNTGGDGAGVFRLISNNFANFKNGRNSAPAFGDVDSDGDEDLIVGTEEGRVFLYLNTGRSGQGQWKPETSIFSLVRVGKNAAPTFANLSGGQGPDLIVGNLQGRLHYYQRNRGRKLGYTLISRKFLGLDVGVNANPLFAPLAGKTSMVLLVGSDRGQITVLEAAGKNRLSSTSWQERRSFLEGLPMPLGSYPAVTDWDRDGDIDLAVGSDKGEILFFQNKVRSRDASGG